MWHNLGVVCRDLPFVLVIKKEEECRALRDKQACFSEFIIGCNSPCTLDVPLKSALRKELYVSGEEKHRTV